MRLWRTLGRWVSRQAHRIPIEAIVVVAVLAGFGVFLNYDPLISSGSLITVVDALTNAAFFGALASGAMFLYLGIWVLLLRELGELWTWLAVGSAHLTAWTLVDTTRPLAAGWCQFGWTYVLWVMLWGMIWFGLVVVLPGAALGRRKRTRSTHIPSGSKPQPRPASRRLGSWRTHRPGPHSL